MPKQVASLRSVAVAAIVAAVPALSVPSVAQADQHAEKTHAAIVSPKKHAAIPPKRYAAEPEVARCSGHIGTCSRHACPHGPREIRITTDRDPV
jgi:hypothetical protein